MRPAAATAAAAAAATAPTPCVCPRRADSHQTGPLGLTTATNVVLRLAGSVSRCHCRLSRTRADAKAGWVPPLPSHVGWWVLRCRLQLQHLLMKWRRLRRSEEGELLR